MKNIDLFFSKCILIYFLILISINDSISQTVGINSTGSPPNSSAGLDINFPDKGLLIPRVALIGTNNSAPLSSHVAGMIVYNTAAVSDVIPGFYRNNGTKWISILPSTPFSTGDMFYWNNGSWNIIPAGKPGQYLQISSANIPSWSGAGYAILTTTAIASLTSTTATSGGNVTSDGGVSVSSRGICWDTSPNPTIALLTKTIDGTGTGSFTSNVINLSPTTTYYLRAYATNATGTVYGNQLIFTTP